MDYVAVVHKEPESDYGVSFPDFPGCITAGETLEEARNYAVEALTLHVAGMIEDGEDLPVPTKLDDLAEELSGGAALIVSVNPPGKTVRVNITLNESELAAIDRAASKSGESRSAYMVAASLKEMKSGIFGLPSRD